MKIIKNIIYKDKPIFKVKKSDRGGLYFGKAYEYDYDKKLRNEKGKVILINKKYLSYVKENDSYFVDYTIFDKYIIATPLAPVYIVEYNREKQAHQLIWRNKVIYTLTDNDYEIEISICPFKNCDYFANLNANGSGYFDIIKKIKNFVAVNDHITITKEFKNRKDLENIVKDLLKQGVKNADNLLKIYDKQLGNSTEHKLFKMRSLVKKNKEIIKKVMKMIDNYKKIRNKLKDMYIEIRKNKTKLEFINYGFYDTDLLYTINEFKNAENLVKSIEFRIKNSYKKSDDDVLYLH